MFVKGKSGNPSGRPKKTQEQLDFERRCREYSATLGIDRLRKWADSSNPTASLAALKEMAERGFGKSVSFEYLEANVTSESAISLDDLAKKIAELGGEGSSSGCVPPSAAGMEPGK